jgi:hypothetical protein
LKGGELKTSSNNQEGKEENKKMSDDEVLLPLIEQGIVPEFLPNRLTQTVSTLHQT